MESLAGQRIIVTRRSDDAADTMETIRRRGGVPVACPVIEIVPPAESRPLDDAVRSLGTFDWILFTSANSVRFFFQRVEALGIDKQVLDRVKIAAIGPATEQELSRYDRTANFTAAQSMGTTFVEEMGKGNPIQGRRFLFPCSDIAHRTVPDRIRESGGDLTEAVAYCNKPVERLPEGALEKLKAGAIDWVLFTSSSTVRNFYACLENDPELIITFRTASIGPATSSTLKQFGVQPDVQAEIHTIDGLLDAVSSFCQQ